MIYPNFVKRVSAYLLVVLFVFMNLSTSVFAVITNGADALDQIGQPDFVTGTSGTGADEFNNPWFAELDTVNHRLFVSDGANHRVQVYNLDNSNNFLASKTAAFVLGQNFTTSSTNPVASSTSIGYPSGLEYDSVNDRLFVSDEEHNRVLVYDVSTITNGEPAQYVLGQTDFATGTEGISQNEFNFPDGLSYDSVNDRLFVVDDNNSRILIFDASPTKFTASGSGYNASAVIGQTTFASNTSGAGQNKLSYPYGVFYTGTGANARIFVADSFNNRVLIFSASAAKLAASSTGMNASYVLGQPDFATTTGGTTQSKINNPTDVVYDVGDSLLVVVDDGNDRVLTFDGSAAKLTASGSGYNAANVLGQADFNSTGGATAIDRFNSPWGLALDPDNDKIYVTDYSNDRVMLFDISQPAAIPEFSTTVFSLVLLVLGFAIIQKNGGFKKLIGSKV